MGRRIGPLGWLAVAALTAMVVVQIYEMKVHKQPFWEAHARFNLALHAGDVKAQNEALRDQVAAICRSLFTSAKECKALRRVIVEGRE